MSSEEFSFVPSSEVKNIHSESRVIFQLFSFHPFRLLNSVAHPSPWISRIIVSSATDVVSRRITFRGAE